MISFDEMGRMLDELAEELPEEFFQELNGGILLQPQVEYHPKGRGGDLFVLGRYYNSTAMGRHIEIYYGSFEQVYGSLPPEGVKRELRATLRHEFRHHVEWLSGLRDLEVEDERYLADYLRKKGD